jgi:hypothetical protein
MVPITQRMGAKSCSCRILPRTPMVSICGKSAVPKCSYDLVNSCICARQTVIPFFSIKSELENRLVYAPKPPIVAFRYDDTGPDRWVNLPLRGRSRAAPHCPRAVRHSGFLRVSWQRWPRRVGVKPQE